MTKKLKDILELLTNGEKEFIEHHFDLNDEIKIGKNLITNGEDEMDLIVGEDFKSAEIESAAIRATGWNLVDFTDEEYEIGEFVYD